MRETPPRLEYARRLFDNCTDWYKNADSKAQVLLGLDGAFLAFLTGSAFSKPEDAAKVISRFGADTWVLLALMCLAMTISILSAIRCLWSRIYTKGEIKERFSKLEVVAKRPFPPQVMWFFQYVHDLDPEEYTEQLVRIEGDEFETRVMAAQIVALSGTVLAKHRWINAGFSCAAASLILFIAALISYVVHLR